MRVIAGNVKGARLRSPRTHTRPTTELVRGAIFSILQSMIGEDWRAIDLYAGSGALGIEALSRGASHVDFVERNRRSCDIIKDNLRRTGLLSQSTVYCCSVNKALSIISKPYDVIFLDPPYTDTSLDGVLGILFESHLVADESTIVVQHSMRQPLAQKYGPFHLTKSRHYGDTSLSFYRQEGES